MMRFESQIGSKLAAGMVAVAVGAVAAGAQAAPRPVEPSTLDRITDVRVEPERLGPLGATVRGPIRVGPAMRHGEYATYRIRFTNHGSRAFSFVNRRRARFFGTDRGLILADEGCGYAYEGRGGDVDSTVCQLDLELVNLEPGESESRTLTAYAGLRGMGELEGGEYTLRRPVSLKRRDRLQRRGSLGFTFEVGPAATP